MKDFNIRESEIEGLGVFAQRDFKRGEHVFHVDLTKLKRYSLKEFPRLRKEHPELDLRHSDHVGNGKYVIDYSPASYMNHSCDPNCYSKMRTIAIKDVYALRDIRKGEELTVDVTATSIDQFDGKGFWRTDEPCKCGSKNCRGIGDYGDFFKMPKSWQKKYYRNLPPSIRRKYKERFRELKNLTGP